MQLSVYFGIILIIACCFQLSLGANKRCSACHNKHVNPRGRDCPFVHLEDGADGGAEASWPTCRTCRNQHSPPRGINCQHQFLDDLLPDPLMDGTSPRLERTTTPPAAPISQVLLQRLSEQISEMNTHMMGVSQRVITLETRGQPRAPTQQQRDVQGLEGGARSRLQGPDFCPDDLPNQEDDWEVAGAGAGPMQSGKQLKSGALIPAQHDVQCQMDFPHKHVLRGAGRSPPLALDLSMAEFVLGYTIMLENPNMNSTRRGQMLWLLKLLMEDANIRPWQQVRHLHITIIQSMETGQIQWGDNEAMLAIQRQHSRTYVVPSTAPRRPTITPRPPTTNNAIVFCIAFQSNACDSATDHDTPGGFVHHVCAYCLRVTGRAISSHSEADCRRKKGSTDSKNQQ